MGNYMDAFNPNTAKTVKVVFKGDADPIMITENMATSLKTAGNWVTLEDPTNGKILYDGSKSEIKRLEHADIAAKAKEFSDKKWICDYGIKHALNEACNCLSRYTCPPGYFTAVFWKKTEGLGLYPQDLKEEQRVIIAKQAIEEWCEDEEKMKYRLEGRSERSSIVPTKDN